MALRRTTIELDEQLLDTAKRVLGQKTTRATVEEALRRAIDEAQTAVDDRADRQRHYLQNLPRHLDLDVLSSDQMWR
ncbi:MAG: type II toxin-antitoxin system VapB family antitoxin [Geodermatophilaceae bacterium]|jgi:Arc/MetJ family transcription regulator|nr:type II toxin-antitoxin system VapB family antitoxin [Geodermatophilaceae bacterium]MDQ3463763.1 type II toxin-antitoxin system VapB family antitoxin [Actinomycetota bacterium]